MRRIELDVRHIQSAKALHIYLRYMLDLPAYYGCNLDALYDLLSMESERTAITLIGSAPANSELEAYLPKVIDVFEDSARENERITFELK